MSSLSRLQLFKLGLYKGGGWKHKCLALPTFFSIKFFLVYVTRYLFPTCCPTLLYNQTV
jgi:hypothetical protein